MTTKLPRATTKGEGKRKPRAPTQGDRAARSRGSEGAERRRAPAWT